jgi:hypothetical protein
MIIGISGKIGSGKDTVGEIIQKLCATNEGPNFEIKKFAGKLKQTASLLTGVDTESFEDQEFKKLNMGEEWDYFNSTLLEGIGKVDHHHKMTYREFLQKLGTDAMRDGLHINVWVNALFADYRETESIFRGKVIEKHSLPNWVITDMRFPNEMEAVVKRGGITIRVTRPVEKSKNIARLHPSETSLDKADFDYTINNDGTLEELVQKVRTILVTENIIKK